MSKQSDKSGNKRVGSIAEVGEAISVEGNKILLDFDQLDLLRRVLLFDSQKREESGLIPYPKETSLIPYQVPEQNDLGKLKKEVWQMLEKQYQKMFRTFQSRFEEDVEIFDGIKSAEVFAVFEDMAHMMLLFSPTRISADVTFDKSVVLQGHYIQGYAGDFRFYWETFFPREESDTFHSSLNIYEGQNLIHSSGGSLEIISKQFAEIVFAQKTLQTTR